MLIELNRFLTTEDVRREYRVPAAVVDDILPKLPVVVTLEDGTRIHLEEDVDEFLREYSRERRKSTATTKHDGMAATKLTETESNILEALGEGKLTGEMLAQKAGYPCNSNFKNTLSSLVKRGLLANDRPGYRKPKSGRGQD
jgi:hypothetical protein